MSPVPARWPAEIQYLHTLQYSSSLPLPVKSFIKGKGNPNSAAAHRSPLVVIRRIDCDSHPANGQLGLFANRKIPPHKHILDYLGEVHSDERLMSDYDLSLYRSQDGSINVGIDASCMGNEARFINDYRGIRSKPNAIFKDARTTWGEMRMSIWSDNEVIHKGDEILVSYGKAWWKARKQDQ